MIRWHEHHKGLLRPAPNASVLSRQIQSMSSSKGGQTFSRGQQISAQFTSQGKGKRRLTTPLQLPLRKCVTALHVRLETREPISLGPVLSSTSHMLVTIVICHDRACLITFHWFIIH